MALANIALSGMTASSDDVEVASPTSAQERSLLQNRTTSPEATTAPFKLSTSATRLKYSFYSLWQLLRREFRWSKGQDTFGSAFLINILAFIASALYDTLSKAWVSHIDTSILSTVDAYGYVGDITEAINDFLPQAVWAVVGNDASRSAAERLRLTYTLVVVQGVLGLIISVLVCANYRPFTNGFVPAENREVSYRYVQISAWQSLPSTVSTAVAAATRALDKPVVPFYTNVVKLIVNIALDLIFISKWHVPGVTPTVNAQAAIRLSCDFAAAAFGLGYFVFFASRDLRRRVEPGQSVKPTIKAFRALARPGLWTFIESAIRNAFYLWTVHTIILVSTDYANAWSTFNTIRWGLVMVPVNALMQTTLVFVGHEWGRWREDVDEAVTKAPASYRTQAYVVRHALLATVLALIFEVVLGFPLARFGIVPYARWLGQSEAVIETTLTMWRTMEWCYLAYAVSTQLSSILLATRPVWYLGQSLISNLTWVFAWAVVCQLHFGQGLDFGHPDRSAWWYHGFAFGGSLVFSIVELTVWLGVMSWLWKRGRLSLGKFRSG